MEKDVFLEAVKARFPDCRQKDVRKWVYFAEECVEMGQYVDFTEEPDQELAVGKWLDSIYAGFLLVKERHGRKAAEEICGLSSLTCLYPYEMEAAAVFLKDGGSREKIPGMIEEGKLDGDPVFPKTGEEERQWLEILAGAEEYARKFDPFQENIPPYVPKDGAALYFSRLYILTNGKKIGFATYPGHKTMEMIKEEQFLHRVCRDQPEGTVLGIQLHHYVYPGKEPGREVQGGEFGLVCMGALQSQTKEILKRELSYEELMEWAGGEPERETISCEKEEHTAILSL